MDVQAPSRSTVALVAAAFLVAAFFAYTHDASCVLPPEDAPSQAGADAMSVDGVLPERNRLLRVHKGVADSLGVNAQVHPMDRLNDRATTMVARFDPGVAARPYLPRGHMVKKHDDSAKAAGRAPAAQTQPQFGADAPRVAGDGGVGLVREASRVVVRALIADGAGHAPTVVPTRDALVPPKREDARVLVRAMYGGRAVGARTGGGVAAPRAERITDWEVVGRVPFPNAVAVPQGVPARDALLT